eukprot:scaffold102224_cov19-Prasinocladus_malaysianus.AAC.1
MISQLVNLVLHIWADVAILWHGDARALSLVVLLPSKNLTSHTATVGNAADRAMGQHDCYAINQQMTPAERMDAKPCPHR